MKKTPWKPFPLGTIRGPFTCDKGTDAAGGIQYCVNGPNGWRYSIKENNPRGAAEARKDVEKWSKEILTEQAEKIKGIESGKVTRNVIENRKVIQ